MHNKYKVASIVFLGISILLIVIMIARIISGYHLYLQHPESGAPFTLILIIKGIQYGIPAIIGLLVSFILKNKAIK